MAASWNTFLDIFAVVGNLAIYLLWGVIMVFAFRLIKD